MNRIHVIIPALDEAPNLPALFRDLDAVARRLESDYELRLILVDDGSSDGTSECALRLSSPSVPVEIVRHEQPQGPGSAFADAFSRLHGRLRAQDLVLTLEADNTSRLEILDDMLAALRDGADLAFASPYMSGGGVVNTSLGRVILSRVANTFVKNALGLRGICTVSSFYRLSTGSAILRLQRAYGPSIVERVGFEAMVEMAMKARLMRMGITEVPMVLDTSRRIGVSRMRIMRTARGYVSLFGSRRSWKRRSAAASRVVVHGVEHQAHAVARSGAEHAVVDQK